MTEEEERTIYWEAVSRLNEIINMGNKNQEEIIEELKEDLEE